MYRAVLQFIGLSNGFRMLIASGRSDVTMMLSDTGIVPIGMEMGNRLDV